jgi:hypothetical protein
METSPQPSGKCVDTGNRVLMCVYFFQGSASGSLYIDDGQSYDYKKQKYLYLSLVFNGNKLSSRYTFTFLDNELG